MVRDSAMITMESLYETTLFQMDMENRGLSQLMHVDLHWLDVPERVKYKLVTMVYNCLSDPSSSSSDRVVSRGP